MALTEQLDLDIRTAQQQIDRLEQQLSQLSRPIDIPVDVQAQAASELAQIRRELGLADDSAEALNRELGQTSDELRTAGRQADRTGDELQSAGRRGQSAFSGLGRTVLGFAAAIGVVQGARAFVNFASGAITSASDLEQSIGALDAVFGELAGSVEVFGDTADQSVGLARSEFNQLASLLGSQLQTFGFNTADAARETQNLIVLASDLAATFGGPVSEAVEAISSLLRGEVNPIERYGVAMNQAAVNAKALELGLADGAGELSLQAATMARLAILTEQTANAQGQFGREADTTAGRLERISAASENLRADIGEALVPAFEQLLDLAPSLTGAIESGLVPALQSFGAAVAAVDFEGLARGFAGLPSAIGTTFTQVTSGAQAFGNAFQVFGALAMLDFTQVGTQFRQLGEDIDSFRGAPVANQAVQDLLTTLQGGAEPARALESVLNALGEDVSTLTLDQFEPLAQQLVTMAQAAGASGQELGELGTAVRTFGQDAGFSAEGVEILAGLLDEIGRESLIGEQLDRDISRFRRLGAAAVDIAPNIERSAEGFAEFRDRIREIRSAQVAEEIEGIASAFEGLPDGLDAAAEAMRDSEDEIETDFSDFLGRLREELATQERFREGLAILGALGFDDLARVFAEAGTDSIEALYDAIDNPDEARQAEEALDDSADAIGDSFRSTLIDAIEGTGLDLSLVADAQVAINSLVISGLDRAAAQAEVGRQVIGEIGGVGGPGASVDITQHFNGFTPSTPDLTRAAQAVNAVVD